MGIVRELIYDADKPAPGLPKLVFVDFGAEYTGNSFFPIMMRQEKVGFQIIQLRISVTLQIKGVVMVIQKILVLCCL